MHRHGVLGGRCARSSKNETAGSQENRKAGTATTLGATATGHGKLTLRIHFESSDISITGYFTDAGAVFPGMTATETPPSAVAGHG
jgi:hypothetical protein